MGFEAYLGLTIFTATITGILTFPISFLLLSFFNIQFLTPLPFSLIFGVLGSVIATGICYAYPKYVASSRANNIDANLPIIANFMSVLASSGIPPEAIFESLSMVGKEFKIEKELSGIIADIKLRGLDLHTALHLAAEKSPSKKFASMIDGVVTTSHLGGDLAGYLRELANKYKNSRTLMMRRFIDNLAIISEIYITFMVAAPLMLIVMLSVMSFLGGEIMIGFQSPLFLLNLLTFILLPAGVSILILLVDSTSPTR
jgi:flagellar protein FlaJ